MISLRYQIAIKQVVVLAQASDGSGYRGGLFSGMISGMITGMQNMDRDTPPTTPAPRPCRVVKLGGSLLDLPHLAPRLQSWLGGEPDKLTLLLVGGGEFVEAMRQLDQVHAFECCVNIEN
jgi:hypothetical protein